MLAHFQLVRLTANAGAAPLVGVRRWLATQGGAAAGARAARGLGDLLSALSTVTAPPPTTDTGATGDAQRAPQRRPGGLRSVFAARPADRPQGAPAGQQQQRPQNKQMVLVKRKKRCPICATQTEIDYKNVQMLSQFVSDRSGMILSSDATGVCAKQQRKLAKAIKRARAAGLMPTTTKLPKFKEDPKPWAI